MKLYKLLLLVVVILLFTGCSDKNKKGVDEIGDDSELIVTPRITGVETIEPSGFPVVTTDPNISQNDSSNIFFKTPVVIPDDDSYILNYFNYANRLSVAFLSDYVYEFSYDGMITIKDVNTGLSESFHIMDRLDVSDYLNTSVNEDDWYYMGYLFNSEFMFVRYDYIGKTEYSFLIRLSYSCETVEVCAAAPYSKNEGMNNFVVAGDYVYYTETSKGNNGVYVSLIECSIIGGDNRVVYTFDKGIEAHYVFPYDGSLYMLCVDVNEVKNLCRYDIAENKLVTVLKGCTADFLYVYDGCALLSVYNDSYLRYYNMNSMKYYNIRLATESNDYFSSPYMSSEGLYVAVFSWDEGSETKLARLDFLDNSIDKYVLLSKQFYRCVGITGDVVYVEDGEDGYRMFSLGTGSEMVR